MIFFNDSYNNVRKVSDKQKNKIFKKESMFKYIDSFV